MIIEWDADCVDDYGGIPEPGDFIENDFHGTLLVVRTMVCNKSKVEIKAEPSSKSVCFYEDPCDSSESWDEIDKKYLEDKTNTNFLETGLFA